MLQQRRRFLVKYSVNGTASTPAETDFFKINAQAPALDDTGRKDDTGQGLPLMRRQNTFRSKAYKTRFINRS